MISVIWIERQRDRRQDQRLEAALGQQARRPPAEGHRVAAAERRQPAQLHGEDEDQQDADQEGRQADADERCGEQHVRGERCSAAAPCTRRAECRRAAREAPPQVASSSVAGSRSLISVGHLARLAQRQAEVALHGVARRSARTARRTAGRARARRAAAPAPRCVVSCPTMNCTGSPVKLNRPKAMNATTTITATDCSTRRRMKASTGRKGARRGIGRGATCADDA